MKLIYAGFSLYAALALVPIAPVQADYDSTTNESLTACYRIADTGEGFPQVACPLSGTTAYRDLDGNQLPPDDPNYRAPGTWVVLP